MGRSPFGESQVSHYCFAGRRPFRPYEPPLNAVVGGNDQRLGQSSILPPLYLLENHGVPLHSFRLHNSIATRGHSIVSNMLVSSLAESIQCIDPIHEPLCCYPLFMLSL